MLRAIIKDTGLINDVRQVERVPRWEAVMPSGLNMEEFIEGIAVGEPSGTFLIGAKKIARGVKTECDGPTNPGADLFSGLEIGRDSKDAAAFRAEIVLCRAGFLDFVGIVVETHAETEPNGAIFGMEGESSDVDAGPRGRPALSQRAHDFGAVVAILIGDHEDLAFGREENGIPVGAALGGEVHADLSGDPPLAFPEDLHGVFGTVTIAIGQQIEIARVAERDEFAIVSVEEVVAVGQIEREGLSLEVGQQGVKLAVGHRQDPAHGSQQGKSNEGREGFRGRMKNGLHGTIQAVLRGGVEFRAWLSCTFCLVRGVMISWRLSVLTLWLGFWPLGIAAEKANQNSDQRPHIVLVMTDDQGWGQAGFREHPVLKTPHLDAMAQAGLRFDRFYAAAPVCSPTRASVLTGRSNMRTGVESHGYALRLQERTVAQALKEAGYATGHFGKWHLNGLRGPGVPILEKDTHHPGVFGFDIWLSVTNFFDRNPIMSRQGQFEEFEGDSSEIIVEEALKFIGQQATAKLPSFTVIWHGSPHDPFVASDGDLEPFASAGLDRASQHHHGELVAMDRSMGALRRGLRELGVERNTLVWFCSDNGGLGKIAPSSVGQLRGFKGSLYESGLRVPAVVEWPAVVAAGRVTRFPSVVMDMFPTIAEVVGLPESAWLNPQDGQSLLPLLRTPDHESEKREKPIPFHCFGEAAWLDYPHKLMKVGRKRGPQRYELYHLEKDPGEMKNLLALQPDLAQRMRQGLDEWLRSMEKSVAGADYPEGKLLPGNPAPRFWMGDPGYAPYLDAWRQRPEYGERIRRHEQRR